MAITFNADEIYQMAEQIERNGAKFYRTAAKNSPDAGAKRIFEELADMEAEHIKTFADMRAKLTPGDQLGVYDPDDEGAKYLHAIVQGRIFDVNADPAEQLSGSETPQDITNIAIGLEKDSIIFYQAMIDRVPSDSGKEKIGAIIKEEMGHILLLKDKLNDFS